VVSARLDGAETYGAEVRVKPSWSESEATRVRDAFTLKGGSAPFSPWTMAPRGAPSVELIIADPPQGRRRSFRR
jgi:hypothetical protein